MIEKKVRTETLRARAAQLERELAGIRKELAGSGAEPLPSKAPRSRKVTAAAPARTAKPTKRPATRALRTERVGGVEFRHRVGARSVRTMLIETMSRHRQPMRVKRLGQILRRKGWKSTRKEPTRTIDAVLRNNPSIFRKIAPGQFVLVPAGSKRPT
jgi:hypothetical protein